MANIDVSRSATEFRKHFTSVRAQMGRVFTDDDHNDNESLHGEDERRARVHIIGPSGSPDAGFLIKNPTVTNGKINFDITPGTFYLGGNRLDLEQLEKVERFQTQSDWLNMGTANIPAPPTNTNRFDLVYLECWQQAVSAVEDNELFEVALGGADTGTRMRLMRRVRVFAGGQTGDCHQDWDELITQWVDARLGTLNEQNELSVNTKLMVGFEPGSDQNDLCSPPVNGGYLGAENQAIRVQLVDSSHFTWGFDNAAPLYRVTVGPNNNDQLRKITMITEPKDNAHEPVAGQIVEILPWSAVLPSKEKLSEVSGFLARVDESYNPDTQEFFLAADVDANFGKDWLTRPDVNDLQPEFFYLRLWNRDTDKLSPIMIPFVNGTPVPLGNSGLNVTFTGSDHHPDDFWIIAARPESPNRVVPWLLETGRQPDGMRRYYAPLAVIEWTPGGNNATGKVLHDCRETFRPLTRIRTCCTCTVGDGTHSFGTSPTIQAAIDSLPDGGEICILSGVYQENFHLLNRHDISIHGCGPHTVLMDDGNAQSAVITIQDSQRIAIRDLAIETPAVIGIQLAEQKKLSLQFIDLDNLKIAARDRSAIECRGGSFIRIRHNEIEAQQLADPLDNLSNIGKSPLVFIRADDVLIELNRLAAVARGRLFLARGGLHIGGGSERVEVRRNHILGGNGDGITLGSITFIGQFNVGIPSSAGSILLFPMFDFVIDDNGCLQPDPNPQDPTDPSGNPFIPYSDGDLTDIRILENDILDMGVSGISTLRYFKQYIVVRDLDVEGNRIRHCLQLDLGDNPFGQGTVLGFGGVSLVSTEAFTLRRNWIESNGKSFIDPACGVFVGTARGLCIENNYIADNGQRINTNKQPTAGPRGGIIVYLTRTPLVDVGNPVVQTISHEGLPAARIAGNTVIAPLGRALWLGAQGLVSVEGNEFTSRGVERDGIPQGVTVTILNTGISYDLGQFIGYLPMVNQHPTGGTLWEEALAAASFIGGKILFNDNQVLLAPQGGGDEPIGTSILILTADDALLDGNQSECRLAKQTLDANGYVFGWSARVTDNRFEERLRSPGVSAFTWAALNCTTDNQGTRCFIVVGIPELTVNTSNRSLMDLSGKNLCQELSATVAGAVKAED